MDDGGHVSPRDRVLVGGIVDNGNENERAVKRPRTIEAVGCGDEIPALNEDAGAVAAEQVLVARMIEDTNSSNSAFVVLREPMRQVLGD